MRALLLLVMLLCGISSAQAETPAIELPEIKVMSGGIGEDGRAEIDAVQNQYTLKLVLVGERGIYLDDAHIIIRDKTNTALVDTTSEGPMFLANLPAGRYMIEATIEEHAVKQAVRITSKKLKTYTLRFPIAE